MDERAMVAALRGLRENPAEQRALLRTIWDVNSPKVQKAAWMYYRSAEHLDTKVIEEQEFLERYVESCYKNAILAAGASVEASPAFDFQPTPRTLLLCWHFSAYPIVGWSLLAQSATVLVARSSVVLEEFEKQGLCLNFRQNGFATRLANRFKNHRPVMAMFDYCYPESRSLEVPFLGHICMTPVGILHLSKRFDYSIQLVAPRDGRIASIKTIDVDQPVETIALSINKAIEAEILERPADWLMWPSLDQRWPENQPSST